MLAKYTKNSVSVDVSAETVAPAAAKLSVPAPSLTSAYPLTPASALGSVQVTLLAIVAGAWNATQLLLSASAKRRSLCAVSIALLCS